MSDDIRKHISKMETVRFCVMWAAVTVIFCALAYCTAAQARDLDWSDCFVATVPEVHGTPAVSEVHELAMFFDFDRAELRPEYAERLETLARELRASGAIAVVGAHTDARGSDAYNDALSARRLDTVVRALESVGVPAVRLQAAAYGKRRARIPAAADERSREADRRVDVAFTVVTPSTIGTPEQRAAIAVTYVRSLWIEQRTASTPSAAVWVFHNLGGHYDR